MERNFENDVKTNKFKLDEECEKQSSLIYYYSSLLTDAKDRKDHESDKLDVMLAETELEIRKNPPEGMKITESSIKALVATNKEIIKQKEKYLEAKREVNILAGAEKALEHKKASLENLVYLWGKNYYNGSPDGQTKLSRKDQIGLEIRKNLNK